MPKRDPGRRPFDPWYLALALQTVLVLFISYYNRYLALLGALAVLGLALYASNVRTQQQPPGNHLHLVPPGPEGVLRQVLLRSPFPLVFTAASGRILLASQSFRELFPQAERGRKLADVAAAVAEGAEASLAVAGREFVVRLREHDSAKGRIHVYYLEDVSRIREQEVALKNQAPVVGLLQVDNYEEVLAGTPEGQRPLLKAAIDKLLTEWAQGFRAYLHKYAEDRYTIFFCASGLAQCQEDKFSILDRVKEISLGNNLPVTISLGLGSGSTDVLELAGFAQTALDLALGRGGDQVVLKTPQDFTYYGGKTKAPEKRTKVKARVIAQALRELVAGSDKVVVMGHRGADPDSLGAGVALAKAARDLGRPGYFVLDEVTPAVEKLYTYLSEHESYRDVFVDSAAALKFVTKETLVIVEDTHKPSLVEAPRLLNRTDKVVVIDHHRRAEEFVADPTLVYLESYASSTSELTTEVLQYLERVKVTSLEATALLAGIAVDTKNFAFQTGVRTFEAAAYLRRSGADSRLVQSLFQDDLASFLRRAETIRSAELLPGGLAVAEVTESSPDSQLLAAQVANELLNIEEIKASFVVYPIKDGAAVSARSLGDVNVQVLMEKLDGGGHLNIAGAQLPGFSVGTAHEKLRSVLQEYLNEEDVKK